MTVQDVPKQYKEMQVLARQLAKEDTDRFNMISTSGLTSKQLKDESDRYEKHLLNMLSMVISIEGSLL